jgi:hypothetical protein
LALGSFIPAQFCGSDSRQLGHFTGFIATSRAKARARTVAKRRAARTWAVGVRLRAAAKRRAARTRAVGVRLRAAAKRRAVHMRVAAKRRAAHTLAAALRLRAGHTLALRLAADSPRGQVEARRLDARQAAAVRDSLLAAAWQGRQLHALATPRAAPPYRSRLRGSGARQWR